MNRGNTSPPGAREPERSCLVTGGAGFVGSHLCERLASRGRQVTVLDDLSTGSLDNLAALEGHRSFRVVVGSVSDPAVLDPLVAGAEIVYHLAAAVGVRTIVDHPLGSLRTNVEGTLNVLEAAARHGCRVLLTSTSEVYGKNEKTPFSEESDIVLGATSTSRWGYACSKALDEFVALAYFHERSLPVVVVRLFNTIGPRQTGRYGMVVPRFVGQALAGEPITVFGDGRQTRCFTYVSDAVDAMELLAARPEATGRVFNIGTKSETSILELAEKIRRLCGSRSPVVMTAPEEEYGKGFEDMRRRVPDLTRLEQLIGYLPGVSLDEALERIIASVRTARRMP